MSNQVTETLKNQRMLCESCRMPLEMVDGELMCTFEKCPKAGAPITNPTTLELWNKLKEQEKS